MDTCISTIIESRKLFRQLIEGLTIEEINKVPEGFNNNIIWNFGHVIVSQQILCYKLAALPLKIDPSYLLKYSKGTMPETFFDEAELEFLKTQSVLLIEHLIEDMNANLFNNYTPYTTSFNVSLTSVDDAVKFLTMHEGLHLGYAMAIKRAIK